MRKRFCKAISLLHRRCAAEARQLLLWARCRTGCAWRLGLLGWGYCDKCRGTTSVSLRRKSNCRIQSPAAVPGANFHWRAASIARSAKKRLGLGELKPADVTAPAESTETLTLTRTLP